MSSNAKYAEELANQVALMMAEDGLQWIKPWVDMGEFFNPLTRVVYSGQNIIALMVATHIRGFTDPRFVTFNQAKVAGGSIRKGAKGVKLARWGSYYQKDENGDEKSRPSAFMKQFTVFNIEDAENIPEDKMLALDEKPSNPDEIIEHAEAFFSKIPSVVTHVGDKACYRVGTNQVFMPDFEQFVSAEAYYGVLAHEHIHWTGHKNRCNRNMSGQKFTETYAFEELVAELGSVMLCKHLGIKAEPDANNASYIKGWIAGIKNDPGALLSAASLAAKATDYLEELQYAKAAA